MKNHSINAVKVWSLDLSMISERCWHYYKGCLCIEELERYNRIIDFNQKQQFLASKVLLKWAMSNELNVDPLMVKLSYLEHGKPVIHQCHNQPSLAFNLAHTFGLVVCAIGHNTQIGVDVEYLDRDFEFSEIQDFVFSTSEKGQFYMTDPALKKNLFYKTWTMKEAYLKAIGVGLKVPMSGIEFDFSGLEPILTKTYENAEKDKYWTFDQCQYEENHMIAVAAMQSSCSRDAVISYEACVPFEQLKKFGHIVH